MKKIYVMVLLSFHGILMHAAQVAESEQKKDAAQLAAECATKEGENSERAFGYTQKFFNNAEIKKVKAIMEKKGDAALVKQDRLVALAFRQNNEAKMKEIIQTFDAKTKKDYLKSHKTVAQIFTAVCARAEKEASKSPGECLGLLQAIAWHKEKIGYCNAVARITQATLGKKSMCIAQ